VHNGDGDKAIYFWIDQLCINQKKILERNHQIKQVERIYSGALMTIIWLHDEGQLSSPWDLKETKVEIEIPSTHAFSVTTFKRIMFHTYFSRLWIVQEILLAKRVEIMIEGGV